MPIGPGKYDDTCTEVRLKHKAEFVLLAIAGGDGGDGFSVQLEINPERSEMDAYAVDMRVIQLLRSIADQIEVGTKLN